MKRYELPSKSQWGGISLRPVFEQNKLTQYVKEILEEVKKQGDQSLFEYTEKLDRVKLEELQVSDIEMQSASNLVSEELKQAIHAASRNIKKFHSQQKEKKKIIETDEGVACWRESVAIEKVGLYIPGGVTPLFSTILMLGIPAALAGCKEIVLCSPPGKDGDLSPTILYTAQLVGINKIFKVGGAQAIAAMTYGTSTIPQVYKIFGPGNQYVTKAKDLVQLDGVAIDMPAGPSELLIVADKTCNPRFVAADLLSQAEHGADSQVILLSNDTKVLEKVHFELHTQLEQLPRKSVVQQSLKNSKSVLCNSIDECMDFSNYYAPEHLIIASDNAGVYAKKVINAGSVFLGNYSCESAGDYASGTNHTLPTNGYARSYSGVSLDSFVRKITFQQLSSQGIQNIGPTIELMAETEGLFAHKNAVTIRLQEINNI